MKNLIFKIFGIIFTILLWYLQEIPQEPKAWYDIFLSTYKIEIAIGSLFIAIAIYVLDWIFNCIKKQRSVKRWTQSFLKHIIKEHLEGRNYQTRISILRPQKGYKILLSYLFAYPFMGMFLQHYKIRHKAYWKNLPYKLFDDYLTIYARYGHSDKKTSYTHFLITDRNEENNGIADKCFKEEVEQEVCTVCISNTTLPLKYELASLNVKRYMKESCIDKKYYSTLLSMNTKANNLYAVPIFKEDQSIWGVMLIDNDSETKIRYKEKLDPHIAMYQKIFAYTLQILK